MTDEKDGDDKDAAADAAPQDSANDDGVVATTNDGTDANGNDSKRKADALTDESPAAETTAGDDEIAESKAKKQKQEDPGSRSVDNDEAKKMAGEENEASNEEKPDDDIDKNDSETKKSNDDVGDNEVKDMEIEENTDKSIGASGADEETAEGKDGSKKNEDEEKKDGGGTEEFAKNSANENLDSQGASTTTNGDDKNVKSLSGDPSSSSPDANTTAEDDDATKKDKKNSNPYDSLKYIMVRNDGKPESLIKLVALKSLFSRQLPKMPRTYIARLVFDRKHVSLVILNEDPATKDTDEEVIGSICYRPFYEMRFAEIAFCAVNASHQVKGYGTKLMNLVKKEGARTGIEYFITYADNYAIGYFKKQGFTKNISMPKGRYQGLIKEYDGGTMMECYVHPSIDFTRIPEMLAAQRKFILNRIKLKALSHKVVYDPLPKNWKPHLEGVSRANESAARALAVPGMIQAGWTMADLMASTGQGKDLDRAKNALKSELMSIVRKVEDQQFAWPFREPVDTNEVKDYLDIIKEPIDLLTIDKRIRKGDHYKSKKMLYADLMLMVNNCKLYNDEASTYVQCAVNLERFLKTLFASK